MAATSKARSVLIVDDESAIVEFIAYSMSLWGYNTLTATSSQEALEAVEQGKVTPTLAIIDIAIGKDSGLELAHTLIAKYKNLRILFISGYVNDMVMIDSLPNNTKTGFLQKVFSIEQLDSAVKTLLA